MRIPLACFLTLSLACTGLPVEEEKPTDRAGEGDADTDTDTDTDTDADADPTYTKVEINFDDCRGDVNVDEAYPDVSFSTERGYHLYCWEYATYSRSEPYSAYTSASGGGAGASVDLTWDFKSPVRDLVFYTLGDQTDGRFAKVTITTEDGDEDTMNLVGDGGATSAEKADLSEWDDIVRIEITDMEDSYSVNYDDISFKRRD